MAKYLYNGIELQKIPTVEGYPFSYIVHSKSYTEYPTSFDGEYILMCSNQQPIAGTSYIETNGLDTFKEYVCSPSDGKTEWTEYLPSSNRVYTYSFFDVIWCNQDILNEDGSIYLAASDPVPVLSLTDSDLYRNVNGKLVKHTLYKKVGGELVPLDDHIMA